MAIYAKYLSERFIFESGDFYCVNSISGIDSDGKETPLYNSFNDELSEFSGADCTNSSWGMQLRVILHRRIAKIQPQVWLANKLLGAGTLIRACVRSPFFYNYSFWYAI
jgi:hypothetical protein